MIRDPMAPFPAPIYPQLTAAALPHLVAYVTDLTVHDAAICRVFERGDAAMYAIRPHGTHFCTYRNARDTIPTEAANTARKALDYVAAVDFVAPDARWHWIRCTDPGIGSVQTIAFTEARAVVKAEFDLHRQRHLTASSS
jgi:hypothetical protein